VAIDLRAPPPIFASFRTHPQTTHHVIPGLPAGQNPESGTRDYEPV
jgi:hypothetical protein